MNKFINRLKYYGIGFGMGLVFVFFFFQNRGCSWLPSNRVKNSILDRVIVIADSEQQALKSKGVNEDAIIELLNTGSVEYDKSVKEGKTKIYLLYNDKHRLFFTLPQDNYISEVKLANKDVSKITNSTEGFGTLVHFPNDKNLIHVDSSKILTCQQEALGFINQQLILKNLKKAGKIDFAKTFYFKKPRPTVYLTYPDSKKNTIGSNTIWYKNKITIKSFDIPFETNCK
ncbi:MAG: hypothetical protein K0R65_1577 [Crocinitomicaceae bacterium]|jgi:hypothetical protein|nr:hypothetical protein [Crocinitomicaceae bacterium]